MLRLIGILLLAGGSMGIGFSLREKLKDNLEELYRIRQIFNMLQNEIIYSRAALPEACLHISSRVKEPYSTAFYSIYEEMQLNGGKSFTAVWEHHIAACLKKISIQEEDKKVFLDFGNCVGYADGKMQAQAIEQYMHKLDISVKQLEKGMADKCRIIMSLSVMSGLLIIIILI